MKFSPLLIPMPLLRAALLVVLTRGVSAVVPAAPGDTELISVAPNGDAAGCTWVSAISADGRYVVLYSCASAFLPAGNNRFNIFVRDRQNGTIELVSKDAAGMPDTGELRPRCLDQRGRSLRGLRLSGRAGSRRHQWRNGCLRA